MNTEFNDKATQLHLAWCQATRQPIKRPTMNILRAWMDLLMLGHTEDDIALVFRYLLKEIRKGKRNHGALALQNFLVPENFEKDLFLANMVKAQLFDSENRLPSLRIPSSPESTDHAASITHQLSSITPKPDPSGPSATSEAKKLMASKLSDLVKKLS